METLQHAICYFYKNKSIEDIALKPLAQEVSPRFGGKEGEVRPIFCEK